MFCYAGVLSPNILTVRSVQMARVAPVYVASSRCFFRLVVGTAVYYSIIRIYYSFFLCFTVDWHLDCFPWCPGAQICQLYMLQISFPTPGVTGKFGLGMWNEAGQGLIGFCQEHALVIANILFQQHKRRLYTWTSPDGQHWNQIDYILCSQR